MEYVWDSALKKMSVLGKDLYKPKKTFIQLLALLFISCLNLGESFYYLEFFSYFVDNSTNMKGLV